MKAGSLQGRSRGGVLAAVVVVHLAALWWLQAGLSRASWPRVMPVTLISVVTPAPEVVPPPARAPVPPVASRLPSPPRAEPVSTPSPLTPVNRPSTPPLPSPTPESVLPSSASTASVLSSATGTSSAVTAETSAGSAGARAPHTAPSPALLMPSSQAAYLNNPPPAYPAISRRLGEQGRVLVRVLIGVDGVPQKSEVQSSSGYDRLDRVALQTVMGWRFVPGRRGDVPEAMWVNVPIQFQLE